METDRKGKPAAAVGGIYAKAKQRVLNKLGRRTTLTKNPRVDFISKRVEEIKSKKADVARLATQTESQLKTLRETTEQLNRAMLDAYRDELGDRRWDDATSGYVRVLHTEEKRLVADMERALLRAGQTLDKVLAAYQTHLADVAEKPLTFHTPEEDAHLATVMQTKEAYKEVRTLYSDAMIDADAQLASGGDPSPALQQKVDEAKKQYEEMSEQLCDEALKYEHIYREELSQRVASHFVAEQHLVRGVGAAMAPFYPYTRGLTLDWQEMRAARKTALENRDTDDAALSAKMSASLPRVGGVGRAGSDGDRFSSPPLASRSSSGNPFGESADMGGGSDAGSSSGAGGVGKKAGDMAGKAGEEASKAAKSAGEAVRSASKGLTDMLASYAPAVGKAKTAHDVAKKTGAADAGWSNIKL